MASHGMGDLKRKRSGSHLPRSWSPVQDSDDDNPLDDYSVKAPKKEPKPQFPNYHPIISLESSPEDKNSLFVSVEEDLQPLSICPPQTGPLFNTPAVKKSASEDIWSDSGDFGSFDVKPIKTVSNGSNYTDAILISDSEDSGASPPRNYTNRELKTARKEKAVCRGEHSRVESFESLLHTSSKSSLIREPDGAKSITSTAFDSFSGSGSNADSDRPSHSPDHAPDSFSPAKKEIRRRGVDIDHQVLKSIKKAVTKATPFIRQRVCRAPRIPFYFCQHSVIVEQ